ncbi:transposase [Kitasatospora sp. NPDC101447]|uniref:transposase n=1 Tax=Kitasatospora sp. NPDC101447 TaxID=3364102 RepID=UPI00382BA8DB
MNTHVSHAMRDLINARDWLTVFILPAYAPELNAVEYLWARVKRSLANLASVALERLAALDRNRLEAPRSVSVAGVRRRSATCSPPRWARRFARHIVMPPML